MIRIGIDGKSLIAPRAGVARYLDGLLHGLESIATPDFNITVVSPKVPVRTLPWVLWSLQRATAGGYDVFHFPFYYLPVAPRCPATLAIHDILILDHPEWFKRTWTNPIRVLLPRSARRAAAIVTGSQHVAEAISTHCHVPKERIRVIPYGVDRHRFAPPSPAGIAENRKRLGLERPYLLHLGAIEPRRGVDLAIAATEGVRVTIPEIELVLVGPARQDVPQLSSAPGWVRRLGFVDDELLPGLMAGACAVLAPSRGEGFDLPVLEALACGAAVVASDIAVHREHFAGAVEYFENGDYEALQNAVHRVLDDASLAAKLRAGGPPRAACFSWRESALRHVEMWRQILDR